MSIDNYSIDELEAALAKKRDIATKDYIKSHMDGSGENLIDIAQYTYSLFVKFIESSEKGNFREFNRSIDVYLPNLMENLNNTDMDYESAIRLESCLRIVKSIADRLILTTKEGNRFKNKLFLN